MFGRTGPDVGRSGPSATAYILDAMSARMHLRASVWGIALLLGIVTVQAADFNDDDYHEYILYEVDTPDIDILIVPPVTPWVSMDIERVEQALATWKHGIASYGGWLGTGIDIEYYTVGWDVIPPEVAEDPEIIVVTSEHNPFLLFGVGLQNPISWCHGIDATGNFDWGTPLEDGHGPWQSFAAECEDGGDLCYAVNTNFLTGGARELHNLVAHEVGHCLGIGHVGDALDFSAAQVPPGDIMSYQHETTHCVSSLNILALEAVYGGMLGHPEVEQGPGTFVHMDPAQYSRHACPAVPDTIEIGIPRLPLVSSSQEATVMGPWPQDAVAPEPAVQPVPGPIPDISGIVG